MNKKLIAITLIASFLSMKPLVAMHGKIFRAVQVATSGAFVGTGFVLGYVAEKYQHLFDSKHEEVSEKVTDFVNKELATVNVSPLPVFKSPFFGSPFVVYKDEAIFIHERVVAEIELGDMETVRRYKPLLKHEVGHIVNKDFKNQSYTVVGISCAVQAISSGATRVVNKAFNRQMPKTIPSLVGRSLVATGSIVPKVLLLGAGMIPYRRYREVEADRFACEHAKSRQELEDFKAFFDNYADRYSGSTALDEFKRNPIHPRDKNRSGMVKKYLDKWDVEHKD